MGKKLPEYGDPNDQTALTVRGQTKDKGAGGRKRRKTLDPLRGAAILGDKVLGVTKRAAEAASGLMGEGEDDMSDMTNKVLDLAIEGVKKNADAEAELLEMGRMNLEIQKQNTILLQNLNETTRNTYVAQGGLRILRDVLIAATCLFVIVGTAVGIGRLGRLVNIFSPARVDAVSSTQKTIH
jgi:hypothetical protein